MEVMLKGKRTRWQMGSRRGIQMLYGCMGGVCRDMASIWAKEGDLVV